MYDDYEPDKFDNTLLFLIIFGILMVITGYLLGLPDKSNRELIQMQSQEYTKCLSDLPRNKDCTVTGIVYTITTT